MSNTKIEGAASILMMDYDSAFRTTLLNESIEITEAAGRDLVTPLDVEIAMLNLISNKYEYIGPIESCWRKKGEK